MTDATWDDAWRTLGAEPPPGLRSSVLARWAEPRRAYHTTRHLEECLAQFEAVRAACERPAEVELAIWFHDAIYNPRRTDNEVQSAQWLAEAAAGAGVAADTVERLRALVLATRHAETPQGRDAETLVDVDLAILGAARERFDEYEAQVRAEYKWVPPHVFRRERIRLLRGFLARPAIFRTPHFHARLEAPARANLGRSLAKLGAR